MAALQDSWLLSKYIQHALLVCSEFVFRGCSRLVLDCSTGWQEMACSLIHLHAMPQQWIENSIVESAFVYSIKMKWGYWYVSMNRRIQYEIIKDFALLVRTGRHC